MVKYLLLVLAACGYDRPAALVEIDASAVTIDAHADVGPTALSYSSPRPDYQRSKPIVTNHATVVGGVEKFAIEPSLPSGLHLDVATGAITGTPTADQNALTYTVSAWAGAQHAETTLVIAIDDEAPAELGYAGAPMTLPMGVAMSPQAPHWTHGTAVMFHAEPALPMGLVLDTFTGVISGTPSKTVAAQDYTIDASNVIGTTSVAISIAVTSAPMGLSYDTQAAIYVANTGIAQNHPHLQSGSANDWKIAPGLPAGLSIDPSTGVIYGTPASASALSSYTVTATQGVDQAVAAITIRVDSNLAAPAGLAYVTNPATYGRGLAIATNSVSSTGGAIASYSISPPLPSGLVFDTATGAITGTPSVRQPATVYTVTGTNAVNSSSVGLTIAVVDIAPSNLVFATNPATYAKNVAIATNTATVLGSPLASCTANPTLPAGLVLSAACSITGTPSAGAATAVYAITGGNAAGSTQASLTLTVVDNSPGTLAYARPLATYTQGRSIPPNQPILTGGAITQWSVTPPLPTGLVLESNGTIDGVASTIAAAQTYTVTGANPSGSVTARIQLQVVAARTIGFDNALSTGGSAHACAIVDEGIECWGSNFQGQLGDGTTTDAAAPTWVKGMEGATTVRTGGSHTCAIVSGELWCWGNNSNGQLGFTGASSSTPIKVSVPTPVSAVALGDNHTCAVVDGGVYCFGSNNHGQLADGTTTDRATPTFVSTIASGVRSIAAGGNHTCVQVYGGADCWGSNGNGELGDGTTTDRLEATGVVGMMYGVQAIAASAVNSCAIVNGAAWCWGMNAHGALGVGTTDVHTVPVAVSGLGSGVQAIAASFSGACAIKSGAVLCWGYNQFGQVGDGSTTDRLAPVATSITSGAQAIGAVGDAMCAIVDGVTTCWGMNTFGQLGHGNTLEKHVPTPVVGLGHGIGSLATSGNTTCIVVDGGIDCWGDSEDYLTGNGDFHNVSVPMRVSNIVTGAQSVAVSHEHACAIVNGGAQCWGMNDEGQLGLTGVQFRTVPTAVPGLASGVQQIATGHYFTCALVNGGVQCWGANTDGQLGNNSIAQSNAPVAVNGLGNNVQAIAVGWDHACALSAGIVYCWGANTHGALGNNTTTRSLIPIAVTAIGPGVRAISTGAQQTCATRWYTTMCWGANQNGQIGDGTVVDRLVPTMVSAGAASLVSGAMSFCTCLLARGVSCWGQNTNGQLGIPATETHAPTALPGFESGVQALSVGQNATCAIVAGGVACLGFNAFGELGNGTTTTSSSPVLVSPL